MVLSFLAMLISLLPMQAVDTYGKTESEVLKMGIDGWFKFYTSHAGNSTAAMTSAHGIYADIAASRNLRLLIDPHRAHAAQIKTLRRMLIEFGGDMVALGSRATGGGTMWNTIAAQTGAEAEEVVFCVIQSDAQPAVKPVVVSDVLKALAKIGPRLRESASDTGMSNSALATAKRDITAAIGLYRKIAHSASSFDRRTSDRILRYCLEQAQLVDSF